MKVRPSKHSGEVVFNVKRQDESMMTEAATEPFRLKKILVPIDFSTCSMKGLKYALALAKRHDAALTLLNVVPIPPYAVGEASGGENIPTCLRASGEQELASIVNDIIRGQVAADIVVRNGTAAVEIVEVAKILPADLVIVSTHGPGGVMRIFLRSVVEYVVLHAPCPVLVVRECERECLEY